MRTFLPGALLLAVFMMLAGASASSSAPDLQLLWSQPVLDNALVEASGSASVYVAGGSRVSAYDAETGEPLWRASAGGSVSRLAADGQRPYTLTNSGLLRAFAEKTGDILWQRNVPTGGLGLHLNAVSSGLLLVGSAWEHLTAFAPLTQARALNCGRSKVGVRSRSGRSVPSSGISQVGEPQPQPGSKS